MTEYPGLIEANVYGVAVPGADGKAGMAAIVVDDEFDLDGLKRHLASRLPTYARPLFIRIRREMDVTETFKHKKSDLMQAGFDPAKTGDEIYFDSGVDSYVRMNSGLFQDIQAQRVRL